VSGNFWKKLKKPFFVLAPMADVTDPPFRRIIAKYGKPDVIWTEFVSCDGLLSAGKTRVARDLRFTQRERPIVAQLFGSDPDKFFESAKLIKKMGFDGIDINMGCPEKNINRQGAGASLIQNSRLAKKIIEATKRGAGSLPVSVKTRLGYHRDESKTWIKNILSARPDVLVIHGRTKKEMSKVSAHWDAIARVDKMAHKAGVLVIGNGDVKNLAEAMNKVRESGVDGVMIGRGIFGNPWLFSKLNRRCVAGSCGKNHIDGSSCDLRSKLPLKKRLEIMLEHARLFEKLMTGQKNFAVMKKHFKSYVEGFDGAKSLRIRLMTANNSADVAKAIKEFV
jgi:nifR3 family TIM-barrel protein